MQNVNNFLKILVYSLPLRSPLIICLFSAEMEMANGPGGHRSCVKCVTIVGPMMN